MRKWTYRESIMITGWIPNPGEPLGPCAFECHHADCLEIRVCASMPCSHCQKPIGYGVEYVQINAEFFHADCLDEYIERSR